MNPMEMNTPQILDGKDLSERNKAEIAEDVARHVAAGHRKPHLAAVLVGEDGASRTYVDHKVRSCAKVGFESTLIQRPADITRTNCWRLSMGSTMTLALTDSSSNSPSPTTSTPKP